MLHGYKMSEEGFKETTEFLRNEFSDMVEFVYIMAPHITAVPSADTNFRQQHAWWLKTVDFPSVDFKACFDKTLDYMNRIFIEKGPFDGVFGYSQGCFHLRFKFNRINIKNSFFFIKAEV
jgi:hypothetical protein